MNTTTAPQAALQTLSLGRPGPLARRSATISANSQS
jgi:hypothetical protein